MADLQQQIQRCIEEQNIVTNYLRSGGPDHLVAWLGLEDWLWEETILRLNVTKKLCQ